MAKSPYSLLDKVGVLLAMVALLGSAVWFACYTSKHSNVTSEPAYASNIPAQGKNLSIEEVTVKWTAEANHVHPVVKISLSDDSNSGKLRVFFRSNVGICPDPSQLMGDTFSYTIRDGKFENGTSTMEVTGTRGFKNTADFLAYRNQDDFRWIVDIREANADGSFKKLAHHPLSPLFEEGKD